MSIFRDSGDFKLFSAMPALAKPDSMRTTYVSLNTDNSFVWSVTLTEDPHHADVVPLHKPYAASVPGTLLADLSDYVPDPFLSDNNLSSIFTRLEYASFRYDVSFDVAFDVSKLPPTLLVCDGLDVSATVTLNDCPVLQTENAFHPHAIELTDGKPLRKGKNTLSVQFASIHCAIAQRPDHKMQEWNDPVGGISRVRAPQYSAGWDWGPRLLGGGIVRPIALVFTPVARILDVAINQQIVFDSANPSVLLHFIVDVAINDHKVKQKDDISVRCDLSLCDNHDNYSIGTRRVTTEDDRRVHRTQSILLKNSPGSHVSEADAGDPNTGHGQRMWHGCDDDNGHMRVVRYEGDLEVEHPRLWWPNGMGDQNLYKALTSVQAPDQEGAPVTVDTRADVIGLRKIELVREATVDLHMHSISQTRQVDERVERGEAKSFVFAVNKRRLFAKGANYIPARALYAKTKTKDYESLVTNATDVHMNMLRVWGGGVYEHDEFYNLCDRHGLMIWHDFMFACALYPGDDKFLKSCETEARYQVSRLRNHACMALWCGNNELEQMPAEIRRTTESKRNYDRLFYDILANVVKDDAGDMTYWPSSPHNPRGYEHGFNSPIAGDTHFWDVWHARKPVNAYLSHKSRFCSEFGMQSCLSLTGARRLLAHKQGGDGTSLETDNSDGLNLFGRVMEAHQKNASGNMIMLEYCQRLFCMAKDYASIAYQTQVNQMYCVQTGVEHFRRSWPYCGGAIYWQLNDCWPCSSWSSLEFNGNWKALHYAAKQFFAPLALSVVHHGDMQVGICNIPKFTKDSGVFSVYVMYDGAEGSMQVRLDWSLVNITSGKIVGKGSTMCSVESQQSCKRISCIDARRFSDRVSGGVNEKFIQEHVVKVEMSNPYNNHWDTIRTGWMCVPRLCKLQKPQLKLSTIRCTVVDGMTIGDVRISSNAFAPFCQVWFDDSDLHTNDDDDNDDNDVLKKNKKQDTRNHRPNAKYGAPIGVRISNNFFDVYAGHPVDVTVRIACVMSLSSFRNRIQVRSLVDSYMS